MKILLSVMAAAILAAPVVSAYDHPLYLVSRITEDNRWCATVSDDDESSVVLQPCDFDSAPPNQIWYRRDYEDFSSALFEPGERCMGYTNVNDTFALTDCFNDTIPTRTSWWQEYWKDGTAVQLSDYGEGPLCAAPVDDNPSPGDNIQMLPCRDEGRYAWHFEYASCLPVVNSGWTFRMCGETGCAKAMNPGVRDASNRIGIVVDPNDGDVWLFDSRFDDALCMGTGLMRLKSDPSLCLQQGHGGSPRDGSWMRVYPCECNNPYQQFYCGEPGQTRTDPSLYMATNKDSNLVILREYDAADAYPLWPEYEPTRLPMVLLWHYPGATRRVWFNDPVVFEDPQQTDTYICLFQQGDGNLRILRSSSVEECNNNSGDLIYHTNFSRDLAGPDGHRYFTQLQRDGNLVTRKVSSLEWVWSTCSESQIGDYSLVLNPDDTLSIFDENGQKTWDSSANVESCVAPSRDPIVLLQATDGNIRKIRSGEKWTIPDQDGNPNFDTPVCLYQKDDGSFVVGYSGCESNETFFFESGISKHLPDGEKYYTALQNDGNLVTRRENSREWVWKSCSRQAAVGDFSLVLNEDNSLSIISYPDGKSIWNSAKDRSCVAD